jgi:hypothetical protein
MQTNRIKSETSLWKICGCKTTGLNMKNPCGKYVDAKNSVKLETSLWKTRGLLVMYVDDTARRTAYVVAICIIYPSVAE